MLFSCHTSMTKYDKYGGRIQRKSFLQLAIRASWSQHSLAQTSFQLAPKTFWLAELISQFLCFSNFSKNITCPSGKLKTEFTSPIAKSTSPGLWDTTFFACWVEKNGGEYKLKFSRNTSSTLIMKMEAWQRARNHIDYKTELSPNQLLCLKRALKFILHVLKLWSRLFCHMLGNEILHKDRVSPTKSTT